MEEYVFVGLNLDENTGKFLESLKWKIKMNKSKLMRNLLKGLEKNPDVLKILLESGDS